jgi:hypothetical protein
VHFNILEDQVRKCQSCFVLNMEAAAVSYQILLNNYGTCYHIPKHHSSYWRRFLLKLSHYLLQQGTESVDQSKENPNPNSAYSPKQSKVASAKLPRLQQKILETCLVYVNICYRRDYSQKKGSWGKVRFRKRRLHWCTSMHAHTRAHARMCKKTHIHTSHQHQINATFLPSPVVTYIYIYTHTHTYTRTHTHTHTHTRTYAYMCVCICVKEYM